MYWLNSLKWKSYIINNNNYLYLNLTITILNNLSDHSPWLNCSIQQASNMNPKKSWVVYLNQTVCCNTNNWISLMNSINKSLNSLRFNVVQYKKIISNYNHSHKIYNNNNSTLKLNVKWSKRFLKLGSYMEWLEFMQVQHWNHFLDRISLTQIWFPINALLTQWSTFGGT